MDPVTLPLRAPLGEREAIDGATGRPPHDLDYMTRNTREQLLRTPIDRLECVPMP